MTKGHSSHMPGNTNVQTTACSVCCSVVCHKTEWQYILLNVEFNCIMIKKKRKKNNLSFWNSLDFLLEKWGIETVEVHATRFLNGLTLVAFSQCLQRSPSTYRHS